MKLAPTVKTHKVEEEEAPERRSPGAAPAFGGTEEGGRRPAASCEDKDPY